MPVGRIDGRSIGTGHPGLLTAQLQQGFEALCHHNGVQIALHATSVAMA